MSSFDLQSSFVAGAGTKRGAYGIVVAGMMFSERPGYGDDKGLFQGMHHQAYIRTTFASRSEEDAKRIVNRGDMGPT